MGAGSFEGDMSSRKHSPKFSPISVREETFEELEKLKGPGKTWDRFIREKVGLPLQVPA